MEFQQVRYFLGVARTLNFTRAAAECNVTQPALTRSIKLLEGELGGELIRREGRHTHLTELGERMRPLLQQCHDSARSAKSLADRMTTGDVPMLTLAVSWTIGFDYLMPHLDALKRAVPGLRIKLSRGSEREIGQKLMEGKVDLAIGGPLGDGWDRLEVWPLFTEAFDLVVSLDHELIGWTRAEVDSKTVRSCRLLAHSGFDYSEFGVERLLRLGIDTEGAYQVDAADDMESLVAANFGVALMPASTLTSRRVRHVRLSESEVRPASGRHLARTVAIYGAAGRPRPPVARDFLKLMRTALPPGPVLPPPLMGTEPFAALSAPPSCSPRPADKVLGGAMIMLS